MEAEWQRFMQQLLVKDEVGFTLEYSRMGVTSGFIASMEPKVQQAIQDMRALERGEEVNRDEGRMVGHYWLRAPHLAPSEDIRSDILSVQESVASFAEKVRSGELVNHEGSPFRSVLLIGIGGSALGPQLVYRALGTSRDGLSLFFIDNTDPDGVNEALDAIPSLSETLVLVVSKSGGTKETRNGMLLVRSAFEERGLAFEKNAIAITGEASALWQLAHDGGWLKIFPMWDWVGGRTSVMSAVGLVPASLQGVDIKAFLEGARLMDEVTRSPQAEDNPAMIMALLWFFATGGKGDKDLVVLPYKDRLEFLSRYLQQLIMESLGKEHDLEGNVVEQGINVFGNKGSTDQHAYVQQLRDGVPNFFATFVQVLTDEVKSSGRLCAVQVEEEVTAGDYLNGFLQGTREALAAKGRPSMTISLDSLSAQSLGSLIALFERTVSFYASLVGVNAYHQPGVEAGKKAAGEVLALQGKILEGLQSGGKTLKELAGYAAEDSLERVYWVIRHLAANGRVLASANDFLSKETVFTLA